MSTRLLADMAMEIAKKATGNHAPFIFRQPKPTVLRLPAGWRIPFDVYLDDIRLSGHVLIIFVYDNQEVVEEYFSLQEQKTIEQYTCALMDNNIVSQKEAVEAVEEYSLKKYGLQGHIEGIEKVLTSKTKAGNPSLAWRMILRNGIERNVLFLSRRQSRDFAKSSISIISEPRTHSAFPSKLQYGRTTLSRGKLSVNLWNLRHQNLPDISAHESAVSLKTQLKRKWILWSCFAHATEFLNRMDYSGVEPHNVQVEYVPDESAAHFSHPDNMPILSLANRGRIAHDPSILFHELAHAIRWLFYTRTPRRINSQKYENELIGIEEGFADYFAATLLYNKNKTMSIGELSKENPRPVNSDPFKPQSDERHEIGQQWASLLWELREKIGDNNANAAILSAHIRPYSESKSEHPFYYYLETIQERAEEKAPESFWNDLAQKHLL